MCNCNSNFDGGVDRHANEFVNNEDISFDNLVDENDTEFMLDPDDSRDYIDIGSQSEHSNAYGSYNAYGDIDDLDADDDDDDDYDNYSDLHEEDMDLDMDEGGIRQYRADGGIDYDDDGMEVALQQALAEDGHDNLTGANLDFGNPSGNFEDDVEEVIGMQSHHSGFDGEGDDDEEYDDFLTKRARARRKLRKKLRKSGKSRKEARKEAISKIPKQKLGKLLKYAIKGKTSPETKKLLSDLENKGVIDKSKGLEKVAEEIQNAMNENEAEGTQNGGDSGATQPITPPTPTQAGGGKGKMGKIIMIGVAVAVLGFVGYKFLNK